MSRFVEFELRVKGKKSDCEEFEEIMSNYEKYATDSLGITDGGDEQVFIKVIKGACSSSVYMSMIATDDNLQAVSKDLSLEIEVYGGDIGDGDEFEHYHYKSGKCIDCFCIPYYFEEGDDYDLSDEDIEKYDLKENRYYVIKQEYIPKAKWSSENEFGEQIIEAEFTIPLPDECVANNVEKADSHSSLADKPEEQNKEEDFVITNIGDKEICVGECKSGESAITIPDTIEKKRVVETDGTFSERTDIKEVNLPRFLKKIGEKTFFHCTSLQSISIPPKVKSIGNNAFRGCSSLTEIVIPPSVTEIESSAFAECTNLTSIILPESVKSIGIKDPSFGCGVFSDCKKLKSVVLSPKIKYIGWNTFEGCESLIEIIIPEGVKEIGDFAFSGCDNLKKIVIPISVKKIGYENFEESNKLTIYTPTGSYAEKCAKEWEIDVVNI